MQRDVKASEEEQPQRSHIIDVQSLRSEDRVTQPEEEEDEEDEEAGGGEEEEKQAEEEEKEEEDEKLSSHTVTVTAPVTVSHETFQLFTAPSIMYSS